MNQINASIITIGDELLIGQTIDTNSAFIAQELNKIGVWVMRRVAVADSHEAILNTLSDEAKQADIIIITGGLGPTADDITKPALCDYFNTELREDEAATENVKTIFQKSGRPLTERNLSQGLVPANCIVLPNARGTAPGMYFQNDGVSYFSLPGVPHEMRGLMHSGVVPKIKETFQLPAVVHRTLLTAGIGESFLADRIQDFENALPGPIKLAYLPAYGMVRLRLTGRSENKEAIEQEVAKNFEELKSLVNEWLVADEDISIQEAVVKLLKERKQTVATAESCTGGAIAQLITSIAGASAVYNGTVVSYSNEVKENILGVGKETLQQYGAVSEQTVTEMAGSVCRLMKTDYALATSGIMGPDGGSEEKPVGTVWIAVAHKNGKVKAQKMAFRFDRFRNIELTTHTAFNMLRRFIMEEEVN
ncbi:MAG: competence/damage-inducible protein [Flavisolibacter sp.]|nr:competence/damage-inducible protein [Flavisolibacter sp.]